MLMDKRKVLGSIIGSIMFIGVILFFTYAMYVWESDPTDVVFNISDQYFSCETDIESGVSGLLPVDDYRAGAYLSFGVDNIGAGATTFSITINIENIDDALISEDLKYKIVVDTADNGPNNDGIYDYCVQNECTSVGTLEDDGSNGNFSEYGEGTYTFGESISVPPSVRYRYYLFIYIDDNVANNNAMTSSSMSFTLDVCEVVALLNYNSPCSHSPSYVKLVDSGKDNDTLIDYSSVLALTSPTRSTITVSYNSNGGTPAPSSITPTVPTFEGWYLDETFTSSNKIDANKTIPSTAIVNRDLYAKWSSDDEEWLKDKYITLPTVTKTGYKFEGWYSSSDFAADTYIGGAGEQFYPYIDYCSNLTLYAKWSPNTYNINYNLNGGGFDSDDSHPTSGIYDTDVQISTPTKKVTVTGDANSTGASVGSATSKAQTFSGWTSSSSAGLGSNAKSGTSKSPTTSWSGSSTKNTYFRNLSDTSGTVTLTANWTAVAMTLPTVEKDGYTCGWNESSSGTTIQYESGGSYTPKATSAASKTMYAVCINNTYTITLDNNGATDAGTTPIYEKYNTGVYLDSGLTKQMTTSANAITKPTKTGYTFGGYFTKEDGTGEMLIDANGKITTAFTSTKFSTNTTIHALWVNSSVGVYTNYRIDPADADLYCYSSFGLSSYYWGTNSSPSPSDYTSVSNNPNSIKITEDVAAKEEGYGEETYYFKCRDSAGYVVTSNDETFLTYIVYDAFENVTGTTNTYNTSNYTANNGNKYVISISATDESKDGYLPYYDDLSDDPTGFSYATSSPGAPSSNTATTLYDGNSNEIPITASAWYQTTNWFNRNTYTLTASSTVGGSNTVTNQRGTSVTATNGNNKTLSVKYEESITATATASTNYLFNNWSGLSTSTTSPVTIDSITSVGTITANFTGVTYTITLDDNSATSAGTTSIYEKYNTGVYLDTGLTKQMTTSANAIIKPTKTGYTFGGYFTKEDGTGEMLIDANGKITSKFTSTKFSANTTIHALWVSSSADVYTDYRINPTDIDLSCYSSFGLSSYYWGTNSSPSSSDYTSVSNNPKTIDVYKEVDSKGEEDDFSEYGEETYYLKCRDSAGNVVVSHEEIFITYIVYDMLENVTGTTNTYNTSNYTEYTVNKYVIASNAITGEYGYLPYYDDLTSKPTGSSYAGSSPGAPSSTTATTIYDGYSNEIPITASAWYQITNWFNRNTYTVTASSTVGGSNTVTNQRGTSVTATNGSNKTLSVKYGENITATATANTNFSFNKWSGLSTSTTSPVTVSVTTNGTITANFVDSESPVANDITSTSTPKSTTQTATLTCTDNVGVTAYYWGTTAPTESSTYTELDSPTDSMSITKTVSNSSGYETYYLSCKDAVGNVSTTVSKGYTTFYVYNMLLREDGVKGTYTTNEYAGSVDPWQYVLPSGANFYYSDFYSIPDGADASTFVGMSNDLLSSSTSASIWTVEELEDLGDNYFSLTVDYPFVMWFDRIEYTISYPVYNITQTKRHGVPLTLTTFSPDSTISNFLGWSTSAGATTATYQSGGTYTANADAELYAVWQSLCYVDNLGAKIVKFSPGINTSSNMYSISKSYDYNCKETEFEGINVRQGMVLNNWHTFASNRGYDYTNFFETYPYVCVEPAGSSNPDAQYVAEINMEYECANVAKIVGCANSTCDGIYYSASVYEFANY